MAFYTCVRSQVLSYPQVVHPHGGQATAAILVNSGWRSVTKEFGGGFSSISGEIQRDSWVENSAQLIAINPIDSVFGGCFHGKICFEGTAVEIDWVVSGVRSNSKRFVSKFNHYIPLY